MAYRMKRKQFHMSLKDEKILKDLSEKKGVPEAEVVREAIREYASRSMTNKKDNPLLEMAKKARQDSESISSPGDLSVNHDYYLRKIYENEE